MTVTELISLLAKCPPQSIVYIDQDGEMTDDYEPELRLVDIALLDNINESKHVNIYPKLGETVVLL